MGVETEGDGQGKGHETEEGEKRVRLSLLQGTSASGPPQKTQRAQKLTRNRHAAQRQDQPRGLFFMCEHMRSQQLTGRSEKNGVGQQPAVAGYQYARGPAEQPAEQEECADLGPKSQGQGGAAHLLRLLFLNEQPS